VKKNHFFNAENFAILAEANPGFGIEKNGLDSRIAIPSWRSVELSSVLWSQLNRKCRQPCRL